MESFGLRDEHSTYRVAPKPFFFGGKREREILKTMRNSKKYVAYESPHPSSYNLVFISKSTSFEGEG
jgi:hypothetical protein